VPFALLHPSTTAAPGKDFRAPPWNPAKGQSVFSNQQIAASSAPALSLLTPEQR
jgi:hypothetical protein